MSFEPNHPEPDMKTLFTIRHYLPALAAVCVTLLCVGCSSTGGIKTPDLSAWKPAGPATSGVAAWNYCVEHRNDGDPRRGFGGRVYFYDQDARRPVKIDGNVVVYAYDESVCKPGDGEPTRRYLFEKDDVKAAYVKSKLGHSYNFFVPWDEDTQNGESKKVSLIVRFVPEKGASIMTQQIAVFMPGKPNQNETMAKADWDSREKNAISQVGFQSERERTESRIRSQMLESNENRPETLQTMTMTIPNNYSPAMQTALSAPPQPAPQLPGMSEIRQANFANPVEAAPVQPRAVPTSPILPEDPRATRLPQKVRSSLTR